MWEGGRPPTYMEGSWRARVRPPPERWLCVYLGLLSQVLLEIEEESGEPSFIILRRASFGCSTVSVSYFQISEFRANEELGV